MLAYDHAVESPMKPVANPHPPHFSTGVDVEAFLRSLLPKEQVEHPPSSKPINLPSSSGRASDWAPQEFDIPCAKLSRMHQFGSHILFKPLTTCTSSLPAQLFAMVQRSSATALKRRSTLSY